MCCLGVGGACLAQGCPSPGLAALGALGREGAFLPHRRPGPSLPAPPPAHGGTQTLTLRSSPQGWDHIPFSSDPMPPVCLAA